MAARILQTLIILSLSLPSFSRYSPFYPSTPPTFFNAAQSLVNSTHLSMSLTLQLLSQSLTSDSLTVFAPPDSSFVASGQPSFSLLKSHISPARIPIDVLKNLSQGATLPTLLSGSNLIVTSSFLDGNLRINDVLVDNYTIYDDGSLVIYGIDEFFNLSSLFFPKFAPKIAPVSSNPGLKVPELTGFDQVSYGFSPISPFMAAVGLLRIREYKIMASFLDMQLGFAGLGGVKLTVFAPSDDAIDEKGLNIVDCSSVFRGHVVPGAFRWLDLMMIQGEKVLETFSENGLEISVSRSGDIIVVNGVPVVFADMYCSDWLVIHGLNEVVFPVGNEGLEQSIKATIARSEGGVQFDDSQSDYVGSDEGSTGRRLKQTFRENVVHSAYALADYDVEFEDNPPDYGILDELY